MAVALSVLRAGSALTPERTSDSQMYCFRLLRHVRARVNYLPSGQRGGTMTA
jgi:hypothetical protein